MVKLFTAFLFSYTLTGYSPWNSLVIRNGTKPLYIISIIEMTGEAIIILARRHFLEKGISQTLRNRQRRSKKYATPTLFSIQKAWFCISTPQHALLLAAFHAFLVEGAGSIFVHSFTDRVTLWQISDSMVSTNPCTPHMLEIIDEMSPFARWCKVI